MRLVYALVSLALLLIGSMGVQAAPTQTISYQASDENFPNPERGFYIQRAPIWRNDERGPLTKDELLTARSQGMSMVRTYYLLEPYRTRPLAQSVLDQLTTDFATARSAGVKLVLRFSYNFDIGEADAPLNQVLAHIDQLTPLLRANADVIAFMEAGFVGAWGEWHSSTNNLIGPNGVNNNTRQIAEKLLAALPAERTVALRTPAYKWALTNNETPLTAQEAYGATARARLGAHNDCFLASRTDWGTYPEDDAGIEAAKGFLHQDNQFVPQGGETCNFAADAQPYVGCTNALAELARMRWSTINAGYEEQVLQGWKNGGCYDTIAKKLGYRFRLLSASIPSSATPGGPLSLSVQLANDGFARPYNPRGLELVLRNTGSGAVTRLKASQDDPRLLLPGPGETKNLTLRVSLPVALAPGSYELLLNLPDPAPALNTRPEYSMRLANQNTWEATTGYNKLNASVTVSAAATQPPGTTATPPAAAPPIARMNAIFLPLVQRNATSAARPTTTATTRPSPSATVPPSPLGTPTAGPGPSATPPAVNESRDPWLWPFAQDSIWNMPLGSNARYEAANLQPAGWTGSDPELLYKVPAGAPERPIYDPGSWTVRCSGTAVADPGRRRTMPIPDDLLVPDAAPPNTPNNASAFLLPDGRTLVQLNPLARCTRGGPIYGWTTKDLDIKGPGVEGGHGGSGMSSIGGALRVGELTGDAPIRHALKINVWGQLYLHYNRNEATPGYRWPALRADGYAANNDCTRWNDPNRYACYGGTNPRLEMGALLAIPPGVTEQSLGLTTPAARKLFRALQDYGAYIVDDTAWNAYAFGMQQEAIDEFQRVYGYSFDGSDGPFHNDINKLFGALAIVDNNGPGSVGGGGTPRAPLAPPFR